MYRKYMYSTIVNMYPYTVPKAKNNLNLHIKTEPVTAEQMQRGMYIVYVHCTRAAFVYI